MKKNIITLGCVIATLTLPACVDRSAKAKDKNNAPVIVLTQPTNKESIPAVVATLHDAFTRVAESSSGAVVPHPHLSILMPDGRTLDVPAPTVGNALFGEASPKARQQRLEGHLKTLAEKLAAGCGGEPVPLKVVKEVPAKAFKDGGFQVWSAGGGGNPWTSKERPPASFIEDRDTFCQVLVNAQDGDGRYLIITDSTGAVAPTSKAVAGTGNAKAPKTPIKPDSAAVAKGTRESPASATQAPQLSVPVRSGDNISINVSYPENKKDVKNTIATPIPPTKPQESPQVTAVKLPDGVEPLGKPILFASASAKLTKEGLETIANAAAILQAGSGKQQVRIFLVGRADHTLDETSNRALSHERADAVRAALLDRGVTVEQTYAIGESLSPDDESSKEKVRNRSVQMYSLHGMTAETAVAPDHQVTKLAE